MSSLLRIRVLGAGAALGMAALTLGGCGSSSDAGSERGDRVSVVASTNVYGDIARRIGGDRVDVTSFISDPAQDPHSFEAGSRSRLALAKARVVIQNGGGYDDFVGTLLKGAGSKAEVLDVVRIAGKTAPAGEKPNEHVWYDLPTVARLADRVSAALTEADAGNAKTFTANATAFKTELSTLQGKVAALKAAHGGAGVAITEPLPVYLLEAAGLRNETPDEFSEAVEEGGDVPPRAMRDTLALLTGRKVAALVSNAQTSGPQTERLEKAAKDGGVPVVPVTETLPPGRNYVSWMDATITALGKALS
ncbi:zinc/manganese transport system substrate-binding protein [Actinomadura pelletieri DSM 43383]|uniref:Zinc/manganese transport system substrate-binding protein n=1 Tax=Actinomadura pelletieri DSM 43383 TaxID=1120940 RepID=A0A495QBU0_9ACTN|nr:zinc ABC transporter substrate-binding protein [Actinomadura pelletieri]RKS69152.1 zinc/manganese transport system substrate-binding protein [Actinomadura pelletieri DSM 43383]